MNQPTLRLLCALLALSICVPALASSLAAIQKQLDNKKYQAAANDAAAYLQGHPGDLKARFLQGLALADLHRNDAAIQVFGEIAHDYPKRPEPANNLAVLYAREGKYDKARRWLEAALNTQPAYATAHRNLGDVYTALAAVAYSKALNDQSADQPKNSAINLSMVNKLYSGAAGSVATTGGKMRKRPAPPPVPEPARPPQSQQSSQSPAAGTAAAGPGGEQNAGEGQNTGAEHGAAKEQRRKAVLAAVHAWAKAWAAQDIDAYLDAYADDFNPAGKQSLADWRAERRDRVTSPDGITVNLSAPQVSFESDDRAKVTFKQAYTSDNYSDKVRKTLVMHKTDAGWEIVRETEKPL